MFVVIQMLYRAYGCKERLKHTVTNQVTRRQVKNLTTVLAKRKKKQNVQIIVLANMKVCIKLRNKIFSSCIGRNKLIFGILTCVDW